MRWRDLAAAAANYAVIEVMSREVGRVAYGGEAVVITDKIDAAVLLVREHGRGAAGGAEPERDLGVRFLAAREAGPAPDHLQHSGGLASGRERRGKPSCCPRKNTNSRLSTGKGGSPGLPSRFPFITGRRRHGGGEATDRLSLCEKPLLTGLALEQTTDACIVYLPELSVGWLCCVHQLVRFSFSFWCFQ